MPLADETNQEFARAYGEVSAHFTITKIPEGAAPENIRKEWIGVALPVRAKFLGAGALEGTTQLDEPAPVTVIGIDAAVALRDAGKEEAADYWLMCCAFARLVFKAHEGDLTPMTAEELEAESEARLIRSREESLRVEDTNTEGLMTPEDFGFKPTDHGFNMDEVPF